MENETGNVGFKSVAIFSFIWKETNSNSGRETGNPDIPRVYFINYVRNP